MPEPTDKQIVEVYNKFFGKLLTTAKRDSKNSNWQMLENMLRQAMILTAKEFYKKGLNNVYSTHNCAHDSGSDRCCT